MANPLSSRKDSGPAPAFEERRGFLLARCHPGNHFLGREIGTDGGAALLDQDGISFVLLRWLSPFDDEKGDTEGAGVAGGAMAATAAAGFDDEGGVAQGGDGPVPLEGVLGGEAGRGMELGDGHECFGDVGDRRCEATVGTPLGETENTVRQDGNG